MPTNEVVELIPISRIKISGAIRTTFDDDKLRELADSIRERGVIQPIVCRRVDGRYELIAGERRLRASKLAGKSEIPAIIREADDAEVSYDRIVENLQREDLSDDDKFKALKQLQDRGLSFARISKMTGLSTTTVERILVLETLKPDIRRRSDISPYAKSFIAKAPEHVQTLLASRVAQGEISSKDIGHEVMPAITKVSQEALFSEEEKKQVMQKIVRESSKDKPAKAIYFQERGKKKLEVEGRSIHSPSKRNLVDISETADRLRDQLLSLHRANIEHIDPPTVINFLESLKKLHGVIDEILERARALRRAAR